MGRRLGQHFLTNANLLERIAAAACPERTPLAIEIGPGKGALTSRLLDRCERLIAIELDTVLAGRLRERYGAEPRLTLIRQDALETDLGQWGRAVVAGNLPYYVATPLIDKFLATQPSADRGVFLVQREVAQRIAALPGSRDYGYLSVACQLRADVEILFRVPPAAFRPPPKVDSAVIRLVPRDKSAALGIDRISAFLDFLRAAFRQKRKTLRNNLASRYGAAVQAWPEARLRAEQLSLSQLTELYLRTTAPNE
ncbi:MAG: 16S rRNA (adenine(1518)-N(6)/adenine(1519)-N(6))-dimethyltransferase RsmA [Bryobacteraceae bacterium]